MSKTHTTRFRSAICALILVVLVCAASCKRGPGKAAEVAYVSAPQVNLRDRVAALYNKTGTLKNGEKVLCSADHVSARKRPPPSKVSSAIRDRVGGSVFRPALVRRCPAGTGSTEGTLLADDAIALAVLADVPAGEGALLAGCRDRRMLAEGRPLRSGSGMAPDSGARRQDCRRAWRRRKHIRHDLPRGRRSRRGLVPDTPDIHPAGNDHRAVVASRAGA